MSYQIWSETWHASAQWLETVEEVLRTSGTAVLRGGEFDGWDLEVPGGLFGSCRVQMAIEEHGVGRQLIRFRFWPHHSPFILGLLALLGIGVAEAALSHARMAFVALAILTGFVGLHVVQQCGAALAAIKCAIRTSQPERSAAAADQKGIALTRVQLGQMR